MKVLCYNIQAGCGGSKSHLSFWNYFKANPAVLEKIAEKISETKPDIIGLVEIDAGSFRSKNQIEFLISKFGYNYTSACKYGWASKLSMFKHQHIAILSKYPILETKRHFFSVGFKRLALEAVLQVGKEKVSAIVTHLSLGKNAREKQLSELAETVKTIKKVIVLGDFNAENINLNLNSTSGKTFPSWNPQKQFDYIFSNQKIKKSEILPWQLSDHLSVLAEIDL